jgi:hypothetical protein
MAVAICAANAADCGNCNVDSAASRTESYQRPRWHALCMHTFARCSFSDPEWM